MNELTASGLVSYCEEMLDMPTAYMWGGLMRRITKDYIAQLSKMYPAQYSAARKKFLTDCIGLSYGCDCVGLVKSYLFGGVGSPDYNARRDVNTNGAYSIAIRKGGIEQMPYEAGICVYMPGHIGVYVGDGMVIECTTGAFGEGVVKTKLRDRKWEKWFEFPYIEYDTSAPKKRTITITGDFTISEKG